MSDKKKPQKSESKVQRFQKSSKNLEQLSTYEQEELDWTQDDRLAKYYNQATSGLHEEIISQAKIEKTNLKPTSEKPAHYVQDDISEEYSPQYQYDEQQQYPSAPQGWFSSIKSKLPSVFGGSSYSSSTPVPPKAGPLPTSSPNTSQTSTSPTVDPATVYLDTYGNPVGAEFDLGQDGAFNGFKIVIGNFVPADMSRPTAALKKKGFTVVEAKSEKQFCSELETADICWIISGTDPSPKTKTSSSSGENFPAWTSVSKGDFVKAVMKFHADGGGLYIWGDNDPLFEHANAILPEIFDVIL